MSRPVKIPKNIVSAESAVNCGESVPGVMNLTAAAALLECRSALVGGPAAARVALAKHRTLIAHELAQALDAVGSYATNEHGYLTLHEAVLNKDAATVEAVIVAGRKLVDIADSDGAAPLDLATDDACREILEHHAAVCAYIIGDSTRLVAAALAYCATLSASKQRLPTTEVSLRKYHFDPCFLWAPPAARAAVIAWARSAFVVQLAANTEPFEVLPEDCAGDILEYFEMTVTRKAAQLVVTHCSSPAARAWSRSIIAAAVVEKASADLVPAAREDDLVTVKDCLSKYAKIDIEMDGVTALIMASFDGHAAIVQVLVDASADTEAKDKYGFTALICAAQKGHTATVQILLEAGANKEAKDKDGFTALMRASAGGRTATVEVLVGAGSDKDSKSKNGHTALIWASHCGHTAIV